MQPGPVLQDRDKTRGQQHCFLYREPGIYEGRAFVYACRTCTSRNCLPVCLTKSRTLILLYQLSNAILRPSSFRRTSTLSSCPSHCELHIKVPLNTARTDPADAAANPIFWPFKAIHIEGVLQSYFAIQQRHRTSAKHRQIVYISLRSVRRYVSATHMASATPGLRLPSKPQCIASV